MNLFRSFRIFPHGRLSFALVAISVATICVSVAAEWLLLVTSAQTQTITIRPTNDSAVVNVGNPQNARDTSELSAAGGSWSRICHTNCTSPISATATWGGIPDGYSPIRLEVKWTARATMALYGNDTARVKAQLEYNLGGGWSTWEQYTWTQNSPACPSPSNGSITCGDHLITLPLSSTQSTAAIQVRVTMDVQLTHCDNCTLRVSNTNGSLSVYDIRVIASSCQVPSGETTLGVGWNATYATLHDWRQTLIPPSTGINFGGRKVTEQDPGGGGPDTCWYQNSSIPPQTSITGGTWIVGTDNGWGYDTVGWTPSAVTYYRQQGRAPCQTSFPQRMVIDCGTSTVPYVTNTLRMGLDAVKVWSERAGVYAERIWP